MNMQNEMETHGFSTMEHRGDPCFFPVALKQPEIDGVGMPGWRAVVREDTGDVLHVHTSGYQLRPYKDQVDLLDAAVAESNLDTTGMQRMLDTAKNGSRMFVGYTFPAHQVTVTNDRNGNEDNVALRIAYWDSYDGSRATVIRAGAYRFACANECLVGKDMVSIKQKHTKNSKIEDLLEPVMATLNAYLEETQNYQMWSRIPVGSEDAIRLFESVPGKSKALVDGLTRDWVESTQHTGNGSLWDLYNVLTAWSTHGLGGETRADKNAQAARLERIFKLRSSNAWGNMALAA